VAIAETLDFISGSDGFHHLLHGTPPLLIMMVDNPAFAAG